VVCDDLIRVLEVQSPPEYALEWDNVGLLVGRRQKEVKKVMLAVDATADVCQMAIDKKVDMLITHHPMIFSKIKKVNDDTILGEKILSLIEAGIVCYAMHTNYDTKGGMAENAANILGLDNLEVLEETLNGEGIGKIGFLNTSVTLKELALLVKDKFGLENVLTYGKLDKKQYKIAICPGSGKSVIDGAIKKDVDCLITGDIGHHEGIDAVDMGLSIIDASHYGIEKIFMQYIYDYLKKCCPEVDIEIADVGVPFKMI